MIGLVPCILPRLLSRFRENSFGLEVLPAKSGKNANSMLYDTKDSGMGWLALAGGVLLTIIGEAMTKGPLRIKKLASRTESRAPKSILPTRAHLARNE